MIAATICPTGLKCMTFDLREFVSSMATIMDRQEFKMSETKNQFWNGGASGVDVVETITRDFLKQCRGQYETDHDAIKAIARHAHVTPSVMRRFIQPSRQPKSVSLDIFRRIRSAYADYLRGQLRSLEAHVARVEALDPDDGALRDLAVQVEALASRIRAAL